jgi:hypothetical protein
MRCNARTWWFGVFLLLLYLGSACAQDSTIVYRNSGHALTLGEIANGWDLDGDGVADFFSFGTILGTLGNESCNSSYYMLVGTGTNQLLLRGASDVALIPKGAIVGSDPPADSTWGNYYEWGWGNLLAALGSCRGPDGWDPSGDAWIGNFSMQCIGYIGLRFLRGDGYHYAWGRLRALNGARFFPIFSTFVPDVPFSVSGGLEILDWAYESRPNVGISVGERPPPAPLSPQAIVVTNGATALDLDADSKPDLVFVVAHAGFSVRLLNDTRTAVDSDTGLAPGTLVGADTGFSSSATGMLNFRLCSDCGCFGWADSEGYLGVRLQKHGLIHYGWVQVAVPPDGQPGVFILDWAWNPHPRQAIRAGEHLPERPGKRVGHESEDEHGER